MGILEKLEALGFREAERLGEKKGLTLVRINTKRGWTYERFGDAAAVDAWARAHEAKDSGCRS